MNGLEVAGPNEVQIEYWNGRGGDSWTANQVRMDGMLQPLSQAAVAAAQIGPGDDVLDVGCGCGGSTLAISALGAKVTGIDISETMLATARSRAEGLAGVDFILADASAHAFEEEFDIAFSRFGVMFFADATLAFGNIRTALRPGGRLCFLCWQAARENPWISVPVAAAMQHLPAPAPTDPREPGPFSLSDTAYVTQVLVEAGFDDVAIKPLAATLSIGSSVAAAEDFLEHIGPLSRLLADVDPSTREEIMRSVRQALEPHLTPQGIELDSACWIVTANKGA